ncbi:hypothetical protein SASPL_109341 [Salvia splendens]|uniref:Uncharacterized protein n=1 Tax=Salvia splendens TaxID=180675 RepID=A0A8X9A7G5_SALSN|nr:hypothetical protein SASPL_109341 [Salvia splendens]
MVAALAAVVAADQLTSEEEGEQNAQPRPPPLEQGKEEMALVDNDSGIGSLHAHDEKEPTHAIAVTPGMRTIAIKSEPVPAGSTSEDYRLKAIPFVLKGEAGRKKRVPSSGRLQKPDRSMTSPSASTGIDSKGCFKHALTTSWGSGRFTRSSEVD